MAVRLATLIWTLALAWIAVDAIPLAWWHPSCDSHGNGPAYFGQGFPLPFAQFTGVSSLEYFFLPWVYALDLALASAILFPLVGAASRLIVVRSKTGFGILTAAGSALLVLLVAFMVWQLSAGLLRPARSLDPNDSYFSYRPRLAIHPQALSECTL